MSVPVTRREAVSRMAAGAAAVAVGNVRPLHAAALGSHVHWGQGAWMWAVKHRPGPLRILEMLDEIQAAGYEGVEVLVDADTLAANALTLQQVGKALQQREILCSGAYWSGDFHDATKFTDLRNEGRKFIRGIRQIGGRVIVMGPSPIRMEDGPDKRAAIKDMARFCNEAGMYCEDQGMRIGLHPHVNQLIMTPEEVDMLYEDTDPRYFHLCPDTAHLMMGGHNVLDTFRKYKERIIYCHMKDAVSGFQVGQSINPYVKELGRGDIDFPAIMRILKEAGFQGWLVGELDYTELSARDSIDVSMRYIRETLAPIYS